MPAPTVDAAVPALDLMLDSDRLRTWLLSHDEVLLRRPYLRYKPGTSCVAALRLESGPAYVYAVAEPALPKLHKMVDKAPPGAVRVVDHGLRMALASPAADRDLPAVPDLSRAVARLGLGPATDLARPEVELEILVHKPQRRLVARLHRDDEDFGGQGLVLRAYRAERLRQALRGQVAASQVAGVRSAPLLGASRRYGLMAVAHLPGQALDVLLAAGTATPAMLQFTGAALARLHSAPIGRPSAPVFVSPEARTSAALVRHLCPHLGRRLSAVLAELEKSSPADNEAVLCHGDFSTDQVIVNGDGGVALIDWDRAGIGDPGADLGSLGAAGLPTEARADFLEGYGQLRPLPRHPDWHLAHALLMRVADHFRTGSESWASQVEDNLARIEQSLGRLGEGR